LLEIIYDPLWLPASIVGQDIAFLHVHSLYPADAPLPIAKNGHYADYPSCATIAAAGGPVNYVDAMLAAEEAPRCPAFPQSLKACLLFYAYALLQTKSRRRLHCLLASHAEDTGFL
jgi:hypothetical protein